MVDSEVHYLQSQNGNVYSTHFFQDNDADSLSEFEPLRRDVPSEVQWCSEAFGSAPLDDGRHHLSDYLTGESPDAVNLWIGNGKSVTSIHSGRYQSRLWSHAGTSTI